MNTSGSSVQQSTSTLIQERSKLLAALLQQGVAALKRAQTETSPAEALKEASDYFMEAMRYDRSAPEGFVGMGYLLWLVGDEREAEDYLQEALMLAPEHRDAHTLLQLIHPSAAVPRQQETLSAPEEHPAPAPEPPAAPDPLATPTPATSGPAPDSSAILAHFDSVEHAVRKRPRHPQQGGTTFRHGVPKTPKVVEQVVIDYDAMYDQVESTIQKEVRQLSTLGPEWYSSSNNRFRVEKTEQQYANLRKKYRHIRKRIREVEVEIDCEPLHQMLNPLDMILTRCEYHLQISWQMIELQEMLDGHLRWISQALIQLELHKRLPADFSESRFEYLLGDCDALADQLDALEGLGMDTARLVTTYEKLALKVSRFQDLRPTA